MPRIYTKTGDDGTTSLFHGGRVQKDDVRTRAYGAADEAVAVLGIARAESKNEEISSLLLRLQRELFVLGAELAAASENWGKLEAGRTRVTPEMVVALEGLIDEYTARTAMPKEFVVPGGSKLGAALDLGRTVVRRCEREVTGLTRERMVPDGEPLRYLNRLSDLLFVIEMHVEGESTPVRPKGE